MFAKAVASFLFGPRARAREIRTATAVWLPGAAVSDDAPPLEPGDRPRGVPRYMRKVEPGGPLPPGVDENAPRFEVDAYSYAPRAVWGAFLLIGAALLLAGADILGAEAARISESGAGEWLIVAAAAALGAAYWAAKERIEIRASPTGEWVDAPPDFHAYRPDPLLDAPVRLIAAILAAGTLVFLRAVGPEIPRWLVAGGGAYGLGLVAVALLGGMRVAIAGRRREEVRGAMRFAELTDPARPLDPADLRPAPRDAVPHAAAGNAREGAAKHVRVDG